MTKKLKTNYFFNIAKWFGIFCLLAYITGASKQIWPSVFYNRRCSAHHADVFCKLD